MKKSFTLKSTLIYRRFLFRQRRQASDESIQSYVTDLRSLVALCEYKSLKEELLCDYFVEGIWDEGLQQCLLATENITFDLAVKISQTTELAKRDAKVLISKPTDFTKPHTSINKVTLHTSSKGKKPVEDLKCFRCGRGHYAT